MSCFSGLYHMCLVCLGCHLSFLPTSNTASVLCRGGGRGGAGGAIAPPNIPVGGPCPPNKIGAMTTECVLLLHALDAFQNALYTTTRIYTRADYSSSSPSLYCKLRNACAYVLALRSHTFSGEGVAPWGYMWYRQSRPPPTPNCRHRLCSMYMYFYVHAYLFHSVSKLFLRYSQIFIHWKK